MTKFEELRNSAIEDATDYDVLNWDEYVMTIILRFEDDGETRDVKIYKQDTITIINNINNLKSY
jgi:hypothetical protein